MLIREPDGACHDVSPTLVEAGDTPTIVERAITDRDVRELVRILGSGCLSRLDSVATAPVARPLEAPTGGNQP